MIKKNKIYFCRHCGNVVESLWNGKPDISCCGENMTELEANTKDAAREKHVPVITREGNKVTVRIGEAPHPMTNEHYILCIEVIAGAKVYRHNFKEGDSEASAEFMIPDNDNITARAFCNLHGLWQA
ncbi:MAG TPA: desulfoferrodoxin family protein [Spirochaetota bacterium]|nr:desulfoferrodoxin family protein [Spirochaetota bacterium]